MHPQALAPIRQRFHGEAVIHFCGAGVVDGHYGVVGQIHPDVSVRVWGRRCHYALSGSLRRTGVGSEDNPFAYRPEWHWPRLDCLCAWRELVQCAQ